MYYSCTHTLERKHCARDQPILTLTTPDPRRRFDANGTYMCHYSYPWPHYFDTKRATEDAKAARRCELGLKLYVSMGQCKVMFEMALARDVDDGCLLRCDSSFGNLKNYYCFRRTTCRMDLDSLPMRGGVSINASTTSSPPCFPIRAINNKPS